MLKSWRPEKYLFLRTPFFKEQFRWLLQTCIIVVNNKVAGSQNCNFTKKRLQHRLSPVKFANFSRTSCFTEHLQWLLLTVSGFQPANLFKKRLRQRPRPFSVNFARFLKVSFDSKPPDDCFLCLSVNFEKFLRILFFIKHLQETTYFMYMLLNFHCHIQ